MLERLKSIDYMYWASLIFMVFPIVPVVTGELPSWHLLIDIQFVLAYLGVLTTKSQRLSWLCWVIMLVYVAGYTAVVAVNYIWFFFFLANLLSYHFGVRSLKSLHVWTFLLAQVLVVGQLLIFQRIEVEFLFYLLVILTFVDLMTFGLVRIRIVEDLKEAQAKQNAQINLLLAENERSRIGQDLHDSLGHTFAMLSVKTDLALQLFQMEAYPQVEKELKEIHQISKDTASLTQELESTASMILLELVTNIIKHAKASKVYLKLERTEKELILTVRDDGCGFTSIKGDDLQTVRDRVLPFSGEVEVISWKQPTEVQVRLPYKERK